MGADTVASKIALEEPGLLLHEGPGLQVAVDVGREEAPLGLHSHALDTSAPNVPKQSDFFMATSRHQVHAQSRVS